MDRIREASLADLPALYRICLQTGDAGSDATALHDDPDLLGHLFVGPYVVADPTLSLVIEDDIGVAGYCVGTADTAQFDEWLSTSWLPALRDRYDPSVARCDADALLVRTIHAARPAVPPAFSRFPAHLHIDLLPRIQSAGAGTRIIIALLDRLRERGAPGIHLGVNPRNLRGMRFYAKLGFDEAFRDTAGDTVYLVRDL